jgi:hypothetical protein
MLTMDIIISIIKMKSMLHLNGYNTRLDTLMNKFITNKNILLTNYNDIHPFKHHPLFINAETLFVLECDKNFVYYWINTHAFPNVKNVYLCAHPCDSRVLKRKFNIHLSPKYKSYAKWIDENQKNVKFIEFEDVKELLKGFTTENIQLRE